jgi:hypothetical protein
VRDIWRYTWTRRGLVSGGSVLGSRGRVIPEHVTPRSGTFIRYWAVVETAHAVGSEADDVLVDVAVAQTLDRDNGGPSLGTQPCQRS